MKNSKMKKKLISLLLAGALAAGAAGLTSCAGAKDETLDAKSPERVDFTTSMSIDSKVQYVNIYKYDLSMDDGKYYITFNAHYGTGENGMNNHKDYEIVYEISSIEYEEIAKFYNIEEQKDLIDNMNLLNAKQLEVLQNVVNRNQPISTQEILAYDNLNHLN